MFSGAWLDAHYTAGSMRNWRAHVVAVITIVTTAGLRAPCNLIPFLIRIFSNPLSSFAQALRIFSLFAAGYSFAISAYGFQLSFPQERRGELEPHVMTSLTVKRTTVWNVANIAAFSEFIC